MYPIKTLNHISQAGLQEFRKEYQVSDDCAHPQALLLRSFSLHEYSFNEELLCIARAGAGINNIPIDICSKAGIVVFNTPGANANAVKELLIAALLLSSRKIVEGVNWVKSLDKKDLPEVVEAGKKQFTGPELQGKTIGVIGLGAIGVMVANVALHLGMKVYGFDPYISIDAAWGLSRNVKRIIDIDELYKKCDYITIHIPMTPDTKDYIDANAIDNMKDGVRLINLSRGELINTDALVKALKGGKIKNYTTDFPNEELLALDNVLAIPHLGASTPDSEDNCAIMAARQIMEFLENGNIIKSVNFPPCEMPRSSKYRLTCIHLNKTNMLGQISTLLAKDEVNIVNMINKSRNDYAYTMVDIDEPISNEILDQMQNITGMIKIRVLNSESSAE